MREAIGGTWIFGIVVFFIVLFSGYMAISVNYSKAFRVKNEIINIIEKNLGYMEASDPRNPNGGGPSPVQQEILDYMEHIGYFAFGNCESDAVRGSEIMLSGGRTRARYCIRHHCGDNMESTTRPKTFYTVTVFFRVDLPALGNVFTFPIYGQTRTISVTNSECLNRVLN